MVKLSVIIPTYITKNMPIDRLLLTLKGYELQTLDHDLFEVIVVDDGSDVDVEYVVNQELNNFENIFFLKIDHAGMCTAINRGVAQAKGDYVLVAVDDNVPKKDALEVIIKTIDTESSYNTVYMGREPYLNFVTWMKQLINVSYFKGIDKNSYETKYKKELSEFSNINFENIDKRYDELLAFSKETETKKYFQDFLKNDNYKEYHWLCVRPGSLVIRKKFFQDIGGFDENFDPSGWYSDLELGYRIKLTGNRISFLSDLYFIHLNHIKLQALPSVEEKCYRYLIKKHNLLDFVLIPLLWIKGDLFKYSDYIERFRNLIDIKVNTDI